MTDFFRFPHTPHLAWLGAGEPRQDKVLTREEMRELLSDRVIVEEKVDGANVGFSVDESGVLRVQNRGKYLFREHSAPQFRTLFPWLRAREHALVEALYPDLVLFGEWCYAVHSIRYTRLPDWFLAFDLYDRAKGVFAAVAQRDAFAARVGIAVVPRLGEGTFDLPALEALLARSELTDGPPEGVYVRREEPGHLVARAKLVRAEFVQTITEHWTRKAIEKNALARDSTKNE